MKLASGRIQGQESLLIVGPDGTYRARDLAAMRGREVTAYETMERYLSASQAEQKALRDWASKGLTELEPLRGYESLPVVTRPDKIVCVGLNYRSHAAEANQTLPGRPVLFSKFVNTLVGDQAIVPIPPGVVEMDYEAELVIVIGKPASGVSEQEALDYVAGYMNGNDLSARDLQMCTSQWLLGKTLDGFAPIGPYLVTADEIADPDQLAIRGLRNGEIVQESNTSQMIFSCRYLISYISRFLPLKPGDLIFTGTPEGVILGKPEGQKRWLSPGETYTVAIEGLGELTTTIGG